MTINTTVTEKQDKTFSFEITNERKDNLQVFVFVCAHAHAHLFMYVCLCVYVCTCACMAFLKSGLQKGGEDCKTATLRFL